MAGPVASHPTAGGSTTDESMIDDVVGTRKGPSRHAR